MNSNRKIGGDFEIYPDVFSKYSYEQIFRLDKTSYASGRHALLSILQYLSDKDNRTIYLPNFLCETVVKTVLLVNLDITFYSLKNDLTIEIDIKKLKKNSIFLVINYFGLVDHNDLVNIVQSTRPDVTVICDCVPAFYELDDSKADFSFNSFRKFFAIPEGAFIKTKLTDFNEASNLTESNFHLTKIIGSILKHSKIKDQGYLSFFKNGEIQLDNLNGVYKASDLFYYLYSRTDFEDIKNRRKINSEAIFDLCHKYKLELLTDLKPGKIPSHIPIYIENRNKIRNKLSEKKIFLPQIWPLPAKLESQKDNVFYKNVLTLVVDQRYNADDMKYQINSIIKLLKP